MASLGIPEYKSLVEIFHTMLWKNFDAYAVVYLVVYAD